MLLSRVHRAAHNLKNVCRGSAMAVLYPDRDTDDRSSAEIAGGASRNRCDQPAVREAPRADLNRLEQSGESAACADGVHKVALCEHHGFARSQIRGDHRKGDAQILKPARLEKPFDEILKTLRAAEPEPLDA